MRFPTRSIAGIAMVFAVVLAACGGSDVEETTAAETDQDGSTTTVAEGETVDTMEDETDHDGSTSTVAEGETVDTIEDGGPLTEDFDPADFDDTSATVDNPLFPLVPGAHHVYEGSANDGEERIDRRVVFNVTDLVKTIGGVEAVVIQELDFDGGDLVEAELAFFAQATDGTVWHLGQYPEEYDEGELVATPAWITGVEDALAGISMYADPQPGGVSYSQGWGPAVSWTDRAQIAGYEDETCVEAGCYENVLITEEFNTDEPDAWQLKFYASGVGNVKVGWRGDGEIDQETLELVEERKLDASEMEELRAEALEIEARAYEQSPDVYGTTEPARPRE